MLVFATTMHICICDRSSSRYLRVQRVLNDCKKCMWPLPCPSIVLRLPVQQLFCSSESFVSQLPVLEQITSTCYRDKKRSESSTASFNDNSKISKKAKTALSETIGKLNLHLNSYNIYYIFTIKTEFEITRNN